MVSTGYCYSGDPCMKCGLVYNTTKCTGIVDAVLGCGPPTTQALCRLCQCSYTDLRPPCLADRTCQCLDGYYGPECDMLCPGHTVNGPYGAICGGGNCLRNGTCRCDMCQTTDPATGVCVDLAAPDCGQYGTMCVEGTLECICPGARTGAPALSPNNSTILNNPNKPTIPTQLSLS